MKRQTITIVECLKCGSKADSTGFQVNTCKCGFLGVDNNGRIIGEPDDYMILQEIGELATDYICNSCKKIVVRDNTKMWMNSYCNATEKMARLYKIKGSNDDDFKDVMNVKNEFDYKEWKWGN